jgi:hypothetical protein
MRRFFVLGLVGFGLALLLPASEALALTECRLNFELRGWSFVYRNSNGTGCTPRKVDPRRPETYRGQGPRCQAEADRDGLGD